MTIFSFLSSDLCCFLQKIGIKLELIGKVKSEAKSAQQAEISQKQNSRGQSTPYTNSDMARDEVAPLTELEKICRDQFAPSDRTQKYLQGPEHKIGKQKG